MMNFYYDPILGLQYTYLGGLFIIDLECIPKDVDFDIDTWMRYVKQVGIQQLEFSSKPCVEYTGKITNYKI